MSPGREVQPQKRNTDERIDAIAMSLELRTHDVEALRTAVAEQSANIDKLSEKAGRTDAKIDRLAELVTSIVRLEQRQAS